MPAAKNPRYDGEQKPEKFEHKVRITDRPLGGGPTLTFAPARPLSVLTAFSFQPAAASSSATRWTSAEQCLVLGLTSASVQEPPKAGNLMS
jgi:hypothetical protein